MAVCTFCGKSMDEGDTFCAACGKEVVNVAAEPEQREEPKPVYTPFTGDIQPRKGSAYAPLSVGAYIGIAFLFCIPFVRIIAMLCWSFGTCKNVNLQNVARAALILTILITLLLVGLIVVMYTGGFLHWLF